VGCLEKGKSLEYRIIHKLKNQFSIIMFCKIADVSNSGYYNG